WVLLDFEGEPLRPLAQRSLPDCPLRDVAGMLRSLDYVAGAVAHEHGLDASAWAFRARQAFLDGYTHEAGPGTDPAAQPLLIAALEAAKAVYEALTRRATGRTGCRSRCRPWPGSAQPPRRRGQRADRRVGAGGAGRPQGA